MLVDINVDVEASAAKLRAEGIDAHGLVVDIADDQAVAELPPF